MDGVSNWQCGENLISQRFAKPTSFQVSAPLVPWQPHLTLDDVVYHSTEMGEIPGAVVEVDVKLKDNGEMFDTIMTAGLAGTQICDSDDKTLGANGKRDTARPAIAWWIYEKLEVK